MAENGSVDTLFGGPQPVANEAPPINIVVDSHEEGKITQKLQAIEGCSLEFKELECGDYSIGNDTIIERKSATDFILSVVDNALVDQVGKLQSNYNKIIYIVEGDLYEPRFHQKPFDVHKAIARLTINQDITILSSPDIDQSAMLIYQMALNCQHRADTTVDMRNPADKPNVKRKARRYLLEGLPGVDGDKAQTLLKHFGKVADVLAASAEQLAEVDGIDSEQAEKIRAVLDS